MVEMPLNNEIEQRFGVLPNFFLLASETPEITANLWGFAKSAYLDNPLPSLFKERLFVYLSHLCEVRYCMARHIGFLVGLGYPSGDRQCRPQTVEQVLPLLQRPLPRGEALEPAIALCTASASDRFKFTSSDTPEESAIFACASHVFLQTPDAPGAIVALRQVFGNSLLEFLNLFLVFVRTAHSWTQSHPELRFEEDIDRLLATHETLAARLLDNQGAEVPPCESEARLRGMIENLPGGAVFVVDRDLRYLLAEGEALAIAGFKPEDFVGRTIFQALPPELAANYETLYRQALAGEPFEHEHEAHDRSFISRGIPLRSQRGEVDTVLAVSYDISDRKRAERALYESEEQLRLFVAASSDIVYKMNANWSEMRYLEGKDFLASTENPSGKWLEQYIPTADQPQVMAAIQASIRTKSAFELEHRVIQLDGTVGWTFSRAIPLLDAQGGIVEWLGAARDITERKQAEALLQASYGTFRHLVENSPFGVYVVDADFRLAQVSAGAQKAFENVRPLIGCDFAEAMRVLWTEPFASEAIALFRHTLETGEPYHAPSTIERRQDILDIESYDWKIERITLPDGRFGVVCHFYDLSERQRYEAALRESEEQFRRLADSSPVLIWETDATGLTFVNRYYLEFFGRTLDGVRGMKWANFLHPDDAAAYVDAYRTAFERQVPYGFQCRFLRHDGEYRWLQNVGEPRYGLDRTFLGFVGCSVDVTDIKAVEAELQASEERFRNMADNAPMMVWVTDTTAYCTYLSRSWYEFTGQTEETGLGFGWLEGTHPDDRESAQAIFLAANARQEAFQLEYRLWHRDGRYRTCIDAAKPWFGGDGKFKGYIGSVIDIDDRKQAELQLRQQASELIKLNEALEETTSQLSERNQELDRFVYTVSHDLKAPLRAIANLSQWLGEDLKEQLEAEYQYQLELLQSRAYRMEAMIEGLLAYSRVGRIEVPTEKVEVGELLAEIVDSLMPPPGFIISIQPEMPTLIARRLLLSQVFSNLIGNAIKHCDRPDGRLQITATRKGEYYEFSLADNGVGIAPENHERVFAIFHTLKGRNAQESTGIGLSIVKKIIESEGGSLILESDLGEGATFRFTYPTVPK